MNEHDNNPNRDRVRLIFDEVADLPPTERAAALGRLCVTGDRADAALREEVEGLLASHDAAQQGRFMTSPTAATTVRNAAIAETPGMRVGPYKLLQVIGEGGFGTVFLAEQTEPVRRRVALKIIKLGMDTKQVIARFEAERQALALMDHPHIARVLDAGATPVTERGGGRPYFVMEYVVGDAITQFADANGLDIRARLALFAQVCSAVQHAHTKGIIHRDIKPGNVLVTMTDGKPFARVIDFGIAKATGGSGGLTDKTLFTEHRQLIGTPEYMSPEQAQGSPDIDTRTDVYALGVLLYELLAGVTPFDGKRLRSAAWDEMRRIIKEEEPPTPSVRVTQRMKSGGSASSPSVPSPLRPSAPIPIPTCPSVPSDLRGELDWIVMKSLDKDRGRRYETPSALAADVERHLRGEAVVAAPPSAGYRLRKFVRRNKGPVIAGSAVAAALLVGIAGTTWQWTAATRANNKLMGQRDRVDAGVGKMMGLLTDGITRGPIVSHDEHGNRQGEDDPLAYALDWGIMLAEQLKKDRDSLIRQTDAAEWSAYTANLALAQAAMDAGNWPEARERLAQCPESKRGWEWRWLDGKASAVVAEVRAETTIRSPDASLVIAADSKSLRIATPDGADIGSPIVFPSWINSVSFSADSSAFLVALAAENPRDRAYRVFTRQGNPVGGADASPLIARSALLSPDGDRLIAVTPKQSGGYDIQLFDATGHAIRVLAQSETEHCEAAWSGDGVRVALVAGNRLAIWTRDGESVASHDAPDDRLGKPALSPDGSLAVFVRAPGGKGGLPRTEIWTMGASEPAPLPIPADFPQTVTFSPDGEYLYIRLWGHRDLHVIRDGEVLEHIISPDDMLGDPVFNSGGTRFLLTTRTNVTIHSLDGARLGEPIPHGAGWVDSACFAPDGESIYSASYHRGTIERRSLDGRLVSRASIGTSMHDVACTPDGLVSVSLLNDFSGLAVARLLLASAAGMSDRAFKPSTADVGQREIAARMHSDTPPATSTPESAHASIASDARHRLLTPDGARVVSAANDRVVRFWDTRTGMETLAIPMSGDVTSIELAPDGYAVAIRLADGSIRLFDSRPADSQATDIQRWNDELAPAQALIDALIAGPLDTDSLMDAIVDDMSLTPTRRLVASELLETRVAALSLAASAAFDRILTDAEKATDAWKMIDTKAIKAHITAAAAALEPSDALPPRAIEKIMAQAESWEYRPSAPSTEERLAEAERVVELTREQLQVKVIELEEAGAQLQKQTDAAEWSAYIANNFAALSDPYSARRYLDACAEHLRNWEWRYLRARADTSQIVLKAPGGENAHWMSVASVAAGDVIVARAANGQILCFNAASGEEIGSTPEDIEVYLVNSSPHADMLAVSGWRIDPTTGAKTLFHEAWDSRTLKPKFALPGEGIVSPRGERVFAAGKVMEFSDGSTIATIDARPRYEFYRTVFAGNGTDIVTWGPTADDSYRLDLWDGRTGECLRSIERLHTVYDIYAAGGVVVTTHHGEYRLWHGTTLEHLGTFEVSKWSFGASVSPDGRYIFAQQTRQMAQVVEAATGRILREIVDEVHGIHGGVFSPDGERIVFSSGPFINIVDTVAGNRSATLAGHDSEWIVAEFCQDGSTILSRGWDGTARLWSTSSVPVTSFEAPDDPVYRVGFETSRDSLFNGTHVLAPSWGGEATIALLDADTGSTTASWIVPGPKAWDGPAGFARAFFSPDGKRIFAQRGSSVRAWDASTGSLLGEVDVPIHVDNPDLGAIGTVRNRAVFLRFGGFPVREPVSFRCDDSGRRLLACLGNGLVRVYNMDAGEVIFEASDKGFACGALNADGSVVAIAWADNSLRVYDVESGRLQSSLNGHTAAVVQVLFDPTGSFIATRSEDRTIRLWDTRTGDHRVIAEISQQSFDDWVRLGIGAFSRDGSRLACVLGNTCVVVHTQSGEIVSTFDGHAWPIDNTTFSLDGSRVFTASTDNTIRVWETDTGREVLVLRPEVSHEEGFDIFELSPDGTRLVARYAFDTTIHIFDTIPFRERLKPTP